ncbi:type II secretion system protein [Candidatus Gracilibacteria bacterium]|nr:type II secretion system protein [Candidatus Gracilibacteria bacterium]NUJ98489.1 type II secretion system protein [Candidatus Gracilibacteria bacterium]
MQRLKNIKAFSLLELIVVITLIGIMLLVTYAPYSYYQTKAKVRMTIKDVAQSIYEARNMAINGYNEGSGSISVGLFFDVDTTPNTITFFSFPYSYTGTQIIPQDNGIIKIIKKEEFPSGVQVKDIGGYKKGLLFFQAISGDGSYFYWENTPEKKEFEEDYIAIKIAYGDSSSNNLSGIVKYYTPTNIVDY